MKRFLPILALLALTLVYSALPLLLAVEIPKMVSNLTEMAWQFLLVVAAIALVVSWRFRLDAGGKMIIIGTLSGLSLIIVLAYPVLTSILTQYVPEIEYTGTTHQQMFTISVALGILVTLIVGPLTVLWSQPQSLRGRLFVGAGAGLFAAIFLFGGLGALAAGLIAHSPLYGVAITRVGYGAGEWALKLAIADHNSYPAIYGTSWGLMIIGAVVGALTGLLTPTRLAPSREKAITEQIWPLMLFNSLIPWVAVSIILSLGILTIFFPQIQKVFESIGFVPNFPTEWGLFLVSGSALTILVILQGFALYWLYSQLNGPFSERWIAAVAYYFVLMGLFSSILSVLMTPSLWVVVGSLITGILSLEIFVIVIKLEQSTKANKAIELFSLSQLVEASVVSAILLLGLVYQWVMVALVLILISVVMIADLTEATAPPPGIEWLEEILYSIPASLLGVFFALFVIGVLASGFVGWVLAKWPSRWTLSWLWMPAFQVVKKRFEVVHQHHPLGISMAFCAMALILAIYASNLLVLSILTTILALLIIRERTIKPLPWLGVALAFALTLVGIVGLTLQKTYSLPLDAFWWRVAYALVITPAAVVTFRALIAYTPTDSRVMTRLTALIGVALLVGLLGYFSREVVAIQSGVSRFDGQQLQIFTSNNSALGGRLNYQFFEDSTGKLWYSGGQMVIIEYLNENWSYRPISLNIDEELSIEQKMHVLEDKQGNLWVGSVSSFKLFDPKMVSSEPNAGTYFHQPLARMDSAECDSDIVCTLALDAPVTGMALDRNGDLWAATDGQGALRLEGGRDVNNSRWEFFTASNSGLPSDEVRSITSDGSSNLWFNTERGLVRFDGEEWEKADLSGTVTTIFEDREGQLWVGTTDGGYWGDGEEWAAFDEMVGWPDGTGVVLFFEDSQGNIWAGFEDGALRFDGEQWVYPVESGLVTDFAEYPAGFVWVGNEKGLMRYELGREEAVSFNPLPDNSSLKRVSDLHVDREGGLWVSLFEVERYRRSPWGAIGLGALFFAYLFSHTYRGYSRTPETRARRVGQQVVREPYTLYASAYALLANQPDAAEVLCLLAEYLVQAGDQSGAEAMRALVALSSDSANEEVLARLVTALEADSGRAAAKELHTLYALLAMLISVDHVSEIVNLELAVNPGHEVGDVVLHSRSQVVEELPSFVVQGNRAAWQGLERIGVVLRKYQQVGAAADRLSYLAEALTAIEAAQKAVQEVNPPEALVMAAIVSHWRALITSEIDTISGRAELRLELRTRQVRRASQVTLALRLYNDGRATAEKVVVRLEADGVTPVGEDRVTLERLSSGTSAAVEFTVLAPREEEARVVCRVGWDDRVAEGNVIEFADRVRFFESSEAFEHIANPYIIGHPLKSGALFQGREDIFKFLADNLAGSVQDRTFVLHGQRRTGKTSILYQLANGRLGANFVPVLIDMQELALDVNHTGDLLSEVAYQLARAARKAGVAIESPDEQRFEKAPTRTFNRFLDALEDGLGERHVIIMLDEFELIEGKITEGNVDANILGYFRSLMQHRDRLVFLFTGTHRLEEMSHDYWSILFNIALYRRVSFLKQEEAVRLIRQPVAGKLDVDELAVEKIISLTSGHPYFIQLICWALVNHCNAQERNYATLNDVNAALKEILTTGEAHFAYIWQRANSSQRLALAAVAHTLRPGKTWAQPTEILQILRSNSDKQTERSPLIDILDQLVSQEVLQSAKEGILRYRFQLDILREWVKESKSLASLVERR